MSPMMLFDPQPIHVKSPRGLKPNRPFVPEVPPEITGPCVYGHIITNEHIDHFRGLYPHTKEFQLAHPEALVSVASVTISDFHIAHTATVSDTQQKEQVCLVFVNFKDRGRLVDFRWSNEFITDLETALGITGEPNWYPCYRKRP